MFNLVSKTFGAIVVTKERKMKQTLVLFFILLSFTCLLAQNFSLDFDGVDDYVEIMDAPELNPTNAITVEAWVKMESYYDLSTIVAKDDWSSAESGYVLRIDNYSNINTPQFQIGSYGWFSVNASQGSIPNNVWTHVAGTFDGSFLKIYINGVEAGSVSYSGSIVPAPCSFYIGGHHNNYVNRQWDGLVDEVRLWNVCRTENEILLNMENPLTGSETGLVGLWRLQEGSGSITFDLTANAFDGMIYGAQWVEGYPMTPDDGSVSGLVLEDLTWLPIENAIITIGEFETTTFEDGSYTIDVPPGVYQLTCEHDDYQIYIHPDSVIVESNLITEVNINLTPLIGSGNTTLPQITELKCNYPNPFNPTTSISFSIHEESNVELTIFNIMGQKVKTLVNSNLVQGNHFVIWNGDNESIVPVCSGIYFYKLNVNGKTEAVRKCLLLK